MTPRVLIVDDSPDLVEIMGMVMEQAGIPHLEATSLAQVEALLPRLDGVTLALLDVNLGPDQPSGVDVSNWLRAHHVPCRIVFLTGHAPDHPLVRRAAGVEGVVLAKPIGTREPVRLARESA